MKVSILVPLYGVERYVEQCARSLFEQTFESVEFVFVDDCSPDDSAAKVERVLEEYPHQRERTKILRNEKNMGVSASRNRAIEAATGHFIIFVDGDDWVSTEMVEELAIDQMTQNSDVVMANYYMVDGDKSRLVKTSPIGGIRGSLRVILSQSFDLPNRVWGIMMRRDIIMRHNIRFDRRITMGEDFLFLIQVLYHSSAIGHLNRAVYHYRVGVGTMSNIGSNARRSYIRSVAMARAFLKSQSDYKEFSGALKLSRFNLRRWLLLRNSRRWTLRSGLYRGWCYTLNGIYHLYCMTFRVR